MAEKENGDLSSAEVARRLKKALKNKGKTQAAIASLCGVTPQALTGWLTTGAIHKRHLIAIAEFLNEPIHYFIDPDYDPASPRAQGALLGQRWAKLPERYRPGVMRALEDGERLAKQDAEMVGDEVGVDEPSPQARKRRSA